MPFSSRLQFETANFLYCQNEMSAGDINTLLNLWEASLTERGGHAPFPNHRVLYNHIDAIPYGDIAWESFTVDHPLDIDDDELPPAWTETPQVVWYWNPLLVVERILANPDFKNELDYVPYHEYVGGVHRFQNFMSGNWAWKQAVCVVSSTY